jgi:hypothetical protein
VSKLSWLAVFCGINALVIFVHIFGVFPQFTKLQALTPIYAFLALGLSSILLLATLGPLLPACLSREEIRQRQWIIPLCLSCITLLVTIILGLAADLAGFASSKNPEVVLLCALGLYVWVACVARLEIKIQNRFLLGFARVNDQVLTVNPLTRQEASIEEKIRYHVLKKRSLISEGDQVIVREGDFIPFDGQIEVGQLQVIVNPTSFHGLLRAVKAGDFVFFGMKVLEGQAILRVQRKAQDSQMFRYIQKLYAQADAMQIEDQAQDLWERSLYRFLPFFFFASCAIIWLLQSEFSYADSLLRFQSVFLPALLMGLFGYLYFWKKIFPVDVFTLGASVDQWPSGMWKQGIRNLVTEFSPLDTQQLVPRQLEILDNRVDRKMLRLLALTLLQHSSSEDGQILRDFFQGIEVEDDHSASPDSPQGFAGGVERFDEGDEFIEGEVQGEQMALASEDWMIAHLREFSPADVGRETESQRWCYLSLGKHIIARILFGEADPADVRSSYLRLKRKGIRVQLLGRKMHEQRLLERGKLLELPQIDIRSVQPEGKFEMEPGVAPYAFLQSRCGEADPLFESISKNARMLFVHAEQRTQGNLVAKDKDKDGAPRLPQAVIQFFGEHRESSAARITSRFAGVCRMLAIWKFAIPLCAAGLSFLGLFGYIGPELSMAGCLAVLAAFLYHNRSILHLS